METLRNDFTATGYVMNRDHTKMLMIHHRKTGKWLPPGGHFEPNELPHEAALREVQEETGIKADLIDFAPELEFDEKSEMQIPTPYVILHEKIASHGDDVAHMHVDFIFIMEADETGLSAEKAEVHDAMWMSLGEIEVVDTYQGVQSIAKRVMKRVK